MTGSTLDNVTSVPASVLREQVMYAQPFGLLRLLSIEVEAGQNENDSHLWIVFLCLSVWLFTLIRTGPTKL